MLAGEPDLGEVAVAREADVVELDLVEAELGRLDGDVDVVLPDPLVVGIRPAEAAVVQPGRAVCPPDRQGGIAGGQERILEGDDAADQVEASRVDLRHGLLGVVVPLGGADPPRERDGRRKADVAVLVLDVELDRVQSVLLERDVLVELPGEAGERHRHVHATHLVRKRPRLQALRLWLRRGACRGPDGFVLVVDVRRDHAAGYAG